MFRNQRAWLLYEADKQNGGSGGDGDKSQGNGAAAFQQALDAHKGDLQRFATQLFDDNYSLRQTNRQLRDQVAPAGSVILQGDDAALWQAYRALGAPADLVPAGTLTPVRTELTNAQAALATVQTENTALKRGQLLREVADTAGVVYSVLATLDRPELAYEIADGKDKDGKPIKIVNVKAGEKTLDFDAHAAQNWSAFMPALRPTQADGTPFVAQAGSGGKPTPKTAASVAQSWISERYGGHLPQTKQQQ